MSQELIYTSVPRGLRTGSQGFCTVAMTAGLPQALASRLESLSGYRPIYPPGHPEAAANPVSFAHWRVTVNGQSASVLSRVAFAGLDYTQRSNKLAHHVVLNSREQAPGGPAWVMRQNGVMETAWAGEPRLLLVGRTIPMGDDTNPICAAWAAATGDAGWAGVLAQSFLADAGKPVYLLFHPGMQLLELIDEAIRLLPAAQRWMVTFNTYFSDLPAGLSCAWRCCAVGTPGVSDTARLADALVIDLTRPLGPAPEGPYVHYARTGERPNLGQPVMMPPDQREWTGVTLVDSPDPARQEAEEAYLSAVADAAKTDVEPWLVSPRQAMPKRKPSTVLIVLAIVWPLIVAGGVWWGLANQYPPEQAPVVTQAQFDELRAQRDSLQRQLAQAQAAQAKLQLENDKLRSQATNSAEALAQKQEALDDRDRQIGLLQAQLSTQTSGTSPEPRPAASEPAPAQVQTAERWAVGILPDLPADGDTAARPQRITLEPNGIKLPAPTPKSVLLLLPTESPELKVVTTASGFSLILQGKNNVGGDKSNVLLDMKLQDGALIWTWREFPRLFQGEKAKTETMTKLLQNAAVQLGEGADAWLIQLRAVQQRDFQLDSADPQLDDVGRELRGIAAFNPVLVVRHSGDWQAIPDADGHLITFRNSREGGAGFILSLNAITGTISSNWRTLRSEADHAQKQAHDDAAVFDKLPRKTAAEIARMTPESRRQYDLLLDHLDDEQRQLAIKTALDSVSEIDVDVVLPRNHVVLYRIRVKK